MVPRAAHGHHHETRVAESPRQPYAITDVWLDGHARSVLTGGGFHSLTRSNVARVAYSAKVTRGGGGLGGGAEAGGLERVGEG